MIVEKGVYIFTPEKGYHVKIVVNGKSKCFGYYETKDQAIEVKNSKITEFGYTKEEYDKSSIIYPKL